MDPTVDSGGGEFVEHGDDSQPSVIVFTRRGCGFSMMLRRDLRRRQIHYESVDIWADEHAAAFVRSVANGNETVPTVLVGDVATVNPSGDQVERLVAQYAPHALEARVQAPPQGWLDRLKDRFVPEH